MRYYLARIVTTALVVSCTGCSTVGNEVLLFGTDTKVALDISGDPTGQPTFTLGYKRREAVWLPLATGVGGKPTHLCVTRISIGKAGTPPVDTTASELWCAGIGQKPERGSHVCTPAQSGQGNAHEGANALLCEQAANVKKMLYVGGAKDAPEAYSVMASFGMKSSTQGADIVQYIATGQAARNLTEKGGAALVNPAAKSADAVLVAQQKKVSKENGEIDSVMAEITKPDGTLDTTKYTTLVNKANFTDKGVKDLLLKKSKPVEIQAFLRDNYDPAARPLIDALN